MDASRKCFRLVGGVLVERTVKEVLPALESNKEQVIIMIIIIIIIGAEPLCKTVLRKDERPILIIVMIIYIKNE